MADLGAHKDKNAARVARMKKAKAVPLADPMVGYPKTQEAERKPSPFAKTEPAAAPEKPQEPASAPTSQQAPEVSEDTSAAPGMPPVEDVPPVETTAPEVSEASAEVAKEEPASEPEKSEPPAAESDSDAPTVEAKLSFQAREEDYPRFVAIAEKLGVSPEHIVKKAAQMVAPIGADFREGSATRSGPVYRRTVKFPKASVETWINEHDPLGLAQNLGISLRQVGCNAFDRAAAELLKSLEAKKAKR